MAFEVGQIVEGKVTGIMNYGAFVDLGDNTSGMVHISEVAPVYVREIKDHLAVGQSVKVKILGIDEKGKISLSIKQAEPRPQGGRGGSDNYDWNRRQNASDNFDDMLSRFMASSDEKISNLKKDNRRSRKGGSGGNGGNGAGQW